MPAGSRGNPGILGLVLAADLGSCREEGHMGQQIGHSSTASSGPCMVPWSEGLQSPGSLEPALGPGWVVDAADPAL